MRAALLQLTSGDEPKSNLVCTLDKVREAAAAGAGFVLTPEVTNCVSTSRRQQQAVLQHEAQDATLAALCDLADELGIWLLIGSLALKTDAADGRFANRSFLVAPDGSVHARYDKIHMFDVDVSAEETYRESDGYLPGDRAVTAKTPFGMLGMTICYDLRFPYLYRSLALAGADILTVPSAFSPVTGVAHWSALLQARAIETGCYVLAPAQSGTHPAKSGKPRKTFGHSMAISPWGEILCDAGQEYSIVWVDLDLDQVSQARRRIPSLRNSRRFKGP
jgi:deaminated glutathione amidase